MASTVQGEWHGCAEQAGRGSPLRSDRGEVILGLVTETPDMTLAELRLKERRVSAGIGTLWRFFKRRRITLKKRRRMRPSSNAAM